MAAHNVAYENYENGDRRAFHNVPDHEVPLVEIGVRQARAAGQFLRERGITAPDAVFVSPSVRARQTWSEYGFEGITPASEPRLREQEGGLFDRLPLAQTEAERQRYTEEAARTLDARPPDGESIREHLERVRAWLHETAQRFAAEATVLAVAHYGTLGLLGALCEELDVQRYLKDRPEHLLPGYGSLLAYVGQADGSWRREWAWDNPVCQSESPDDQAA